MRNSSNCIVLPPTTPHLPASSLTNTNPPTPSLCPIISPPICFSLLFRPLFCHLVERGLGTRCATGGQSCGFRLLDRTAESNLSALLSLSCVSRGQSGAAITVCVCVCAHMHACALHSCCIGFILYLWCLLPRGSTGCCPTTTITSAAPTSLHRLPPPISESPTLYSIRI